MNVLLIVRWPVGGIRTFINYVYSRWTNNNIHFHILTPNIAEVDILRSQLDGISVTWHVTDSEKPNIIDFSLACHRVTSETRFDLIHAHGFTSALSIGWKLPFLRCKSIVTSHDVLNKRQFVGPFGALKRHALKFMLNRFSVIQSVSFDAQSNLHELVPGIDKNKLRVILNGVDTDRFYQAPPLDLKLSLGVPKEVVLIGFFGRFMSQKGFQYLVGAISQLEQSHPGRYRVACFGSGSFIREEKYQIEQLQLSHVFFFSDFVSDTAPYIKGCDLVAMPSLWEASGLVAMEVLTSGVPLVASGCIGLREVCKDSPAILVEPANPDSLKKGILEATTLSRRTFSEYATEAKDRYSIDRVRGEIQSLYQELTSR